jgi:recombination protein RecA
LGGQGVPRGRIIEIFGPESSGKTTLALHVVAQAQKQGGIAAFVDAEHALDPSWAKKLGVELETLLVSQPSSGEEAMQITEMLIKSNAVDVIVIDSVAALVPRQELEGEIGDTHVGLQARLMSQSMRKLTGAIAKSTWRAGPEVLFQLPDRRSPHRPAQGRGGSRRPAGAGQGGQEQGCSAVPRSRI